MAIPPSVGMRERSGEVMASTIVRSHRRFGTAARIAGVMAVIAALLAGGRVGLQRARAADALHVAPGGTGDCTAAWPCGTLDAAFARAASGGRILMAGGHYGDQRISSNKTAAALFA